MHSWIAAGIIAGAGLAGGFAKTLLSGSGELKLVSVAVDADGAVLVRGGFLVNCIVGAIAALTSWMLYGASATHSVGEVIDLPTWASCGAAVIVGLGGSAWLSAEADKQMLRKAAVAAANSDQNADLAGTIASASPDQALKAAVSAQRETTGDPVQTPDPVKRP